MRVRELSEEEYQSCFADPMQDVTSQGEAVLDIWDYVQRIDLDSLQVPHLNDVSYVYRDASGRFDHVLIGTGRFNAFLVVVVDRHARSIAGHCLLDLNEMYGVSGGHLSVRGEKRRSS